MMHYINVENLRPKQIISDLIAPNVYLVHSNNVGKLGKYSDTTEHNDDTNALFEYHIDYDKDGKSHGSLYCIEYRVKPKYYKSIIEFEDGNKISKEIDRRYECSDLHRVRVPFFPSEINNIQNFNKFTNKLINAFIDNTRNHHNMELMYLIYKKDLQILFYSAKMEGIRQQLRKHYGLNQDTDIYITPIGAYEFEGEVYKETLDKNNVEYPMNNFYIYFNKKFFILLEHPDPEKTKKTEKFQLLRLFTKDKIDDFDDFMNFSWDSDSELYDIDYGKRGSIQDHKRFFENCIICSKLDSKLFIQDLLEDPKPFVQKLIKNTDLFMQRKGETETINLENEKLENKNIEKTLDERIHSKIEALAFREYKYKYETYRMINLGFKYKCVDDTLIQHNNESGKLIGTNEQNNRRLRFYRTKITR